MNRRDFIRNSTLVAGGLTTAGFPHILSAQSKQSNKRPPNILFVFTDQQTYRALSAWGNPYLYTPNMDALAAYGVRFEQTYCTSPVSGPARSSLITSRMPHETQVNYNEETPISNLMNMGQVFRRAGYRTAWGGKWHLPDSYPLTRGHKEIPGFELIDFYGMSSGRGSGRGDDTDGPLADAVCDFIAHNTQEPFLLGVSFHNPHDICYVPRNYKEFPPPVNLDCAPPLPDNFPINQNEPEFLQNCRKRMYYGNELTVAQSFDKDQWHNYIFHYYRMTERVDREIGKVLTALEKKGLEENTLIVFTTDHGDGVASHRWAAKLSLYEEAVKIPMIVTWFGKTPQNVFDRTHLVSGLDVLPTMCDYAGVEGPEGMLGRSLRPIIENPRADWRQEIVTELAPEPKKPERVGRMLRTGRYKYNLYSYGANNQQLFDLKEDPGETNNLAYKADYKKTVDDHHKRLMNWIEQTNDPFKEIG